MLRSRFRPTLRIIRRNKKKKEVKVPEFGDKPEYLLEYIERVKKETGQEPLLVDKPTGDMKTWRFFSVIYPVGGGVFIHAYLPPEGTETGYAKYIVIEPPRPSAKLFKHVELALAAKIKPDHITESAEEKKKLLLELLEEIIEPVDNPIDYENKKIKVGNKRIPIYKNDVDYLKYHLIRDRIGIGLLEPFLRDPYLEDISCRGIGNIYVVHKIFGPMESNFGFKREEELDEFIIKLGEKIGKPVSRARPVVDATLPDGSRINIIYGRDVSLHGSNFTIRRVTKIPISVIQLIKWGTFNEYIAAYMWMMLSEGMSVFICGETASGKTTTLNAISVFIRPNYKIVTIEDTAEVVLPHPNWVRELTRDTGKPESSVTMFDLLKASLRQRPNYIIVGEIRGPEGNVAFQAMQSVSWDTPVLVKNTHTSEVNLIPIGEFVDQFYSSGEERVPKYINGYHVLSIDKLGRVKWSKIRYVLRHKASEIYEITYEGKSVLKATGSHSVFVLDVDTLEIKPKPVSELRKGDLLVTFIKRSDKSSPNSVDSNKLLIRQGIDVELPGNDLLAETGNIQIHNPVLRVQTNSEEKQLTQALRGLYEPAVRALEKILVCVRRGDIQGRTIVYTTKNIVLAEQLVWLARIAGLESRLSVIRDKKHNKYRIRVRIPDEQESRSRSDKIPLKPIIEILKKSKLETELPLELSYILEKRHLGKKYVSRKTALKIVGFLEENREKLDEYSRNMLERLKILLESDLAFLEVLSVRKVRYNGYVYDISVPETELFLGGVIPVALHNTGHPVMATFHAGDLEKLIQRLTNPPINVPKTNLDNLNIVWFQSTVYSKTGLLVRRVITINEIVGYDPKSDAISAIPVFLWDPVNDRFRFAGLGTSYLLEEKIAVMKGISRRNIKLIYEELDLRAKYLRLLVQRNIVDYFKVFKAIAKAYQLGIEEAYKKLLKGELMI